MSASKEEKLSLTHFQIEVLLRYLFKSTQIVHRLEQTDRELYNQLCEDTMVLPYVSIDEVHDFVKRLTKEIGLDFPFKD